LSSVAVALLTLTVTTALVSTTGAGVASSWFDEQRIFLLTALGAAAALVVWRLPPPTEVAVHAVFSALAIGAVSAVLAPRPYVAALDWSIYSLTALVILCARAPGRSGFETLVALAAGIVPAAYVTGVLANYVSALLFGFPVGAETLLVGFANPRFPAQLQVLTIPLLPLALQRLQGRFWRACFGVVGGLWWMCFIGSGSRTGWIAIAASALVVAFLAEQGRRWLRWQALFGASGAMLWLLLFHLLPALLSVPTAPETGRFTNFASIGARWELWRLSIDAARAQPLLGLGPMHFAYVDNGLGAHPHNFWLRLAAEWGIPAMLLILSATLALLVGLWRRLHQDHDSASRNVGVALFAALIAWGVGTLSDGYMVVPTSQAMSAVVLMLAVMWLRLGWLVPARSGHLQRVTSSLASAALLAAALGLLAALPFTDFGQPMSREQTWRDENRGRTMWPRFWQQGWIGPDADSSARTGRLSGSEGGQ
jgi:O-antigen ligase